MASGLVGGVLSASLAFSCDSQATEPCVSDGPTPILEVNSAGDPATGTVAPSVAIIGLNFDGVPVDSAMIGTDPDWNIERTADVLTCTIPCRFGRDAGTYAFDVHAAGFYAGSVEVTAAYGDVPTGCPLSHGRPATLAIALIEADSARARFYFLQRAGLGLAGDVASVTFDDGSGPRTVGVDWPSVSFVTRNAGQLVARFVIADPDTIAVGQIELPLREDWEWSVGAFMYDRDPADESFCLETRSFALRRPVAGVDSLYIGWSGLALSVEVAC